MWYNIDSERGRIVARFYGTLEADKAKVTKCGTAKTGLTSHTAGYQGAVRVTVYDKDGQDFARVELTMWQDVGAHPAIELYDGPISGELEESAEDYSGLVGACLAEKIRRETQDARAVCEAVIEWAKCSIRQNGNPYCIDFVRMAQKVLGIGLT
jgi:hypothetical protein